MAVATDVQTVELTAELIGEETMDAMAAVDDGLSARRIEMRGRNAIALLVTLDEGQRVERRHNARRRRTDYLVLERNTLVGYARRDGHLVAVRPAACARYLTTGEARATALALQLAALDAESRSA